MCSTKVTKMAGQVLDYAIVGFSPDVYYDDNGKLGGIWNHHSKILKQFMNYTENIHVIQDFDEHVKVIERGGARLGSAQVATFQ